tara:strand:- start:591 stop:1232 length:642 start_codon:yes stop_codon:yes gene_type:complete
MKENKVRIAIFLMFFLNIIGSFGLFFDEIESVILLLTPINLLILLVLFYWANGYRKTSFIFTITVIFLFGFLVELIGVHYKFIFGDYSYGNALGLKIFQTPLIIGVNWINLSLACFGISSFFVSHNFLVALIASTLMVLTDFIIEPLSGLLDFWYWSGNQIPLQNYIGWFLVSLLIQLFLVRSKVELKIQLCFALLISQIIFFLIQYINHGLF